MLTISARPATTDDIAVLGDLYEELLAEMVALKAIWHVTDGLAEPVAESFSAALAGPSTGVVVGEIDGVPLGLLAWRDTPLLPQGRGALVGVIELIFTREAARQVGVGEAMIGRFLAEAQERGIRLFDAIVPPGHRLAKNFFESNGFKARRIVMHRDDR